MKTLKELYNFIVKDNHVFEEIDCACERIENEVYEDEDFEEFLDEMNVSIILSAVDKNKCYLSDGKTHVSLNCHDYPNRHDPTLSDETIYNFDNMALVKKSEII